MDPLDQKDSVDSLVQWDPRVTQGAKEAMESKGQEVFLVRLGMQEKEVLEALGAKLDPRDQSESQVHLVAEECLALMDQWDPKVNQETEVCKEFRAQKASLETSVGQEPLDFKVSEAHQVDADRVELLGQWASLETMVRMVKLESQDYKEFLEGQDLWDLQETKDSLEIRVLKGHLECQVHKVQGVMQEKMDAMDAQDLQAQMGPLGTGVLLAVQGQEVSKACQDLQAKMGLLVKMVPRACRVSWV